MIETTNNLLPPVSAPSAWNRASIERNLGWAMEASNAMRDEIHLLASKSNVGLLGLNDALGKLETRSKFQGKNAGFGKEIRRNLLEQGFVRIRNLEFGHLPNFEAQIALWLVGSLVGSPITQKPKQFVVDVQPPDHKLDTDKHANKPNSMAKLDFHCDASDILVLYCRGADEFGGATRLISSHSLYNALLLEFEVILDTLTKGFRYGKLGEMRNSKPLVSERIPIFSWRNQYLSCRYIRPFINDAATMTKTPFSLRETQALEALENHMNNDDLCFEQSMQVGDVLLINNYSALHGRAKIKGFHGISQRHMMKLWVNFPDRMVARAVNRQMRFRISHHSGVGRSLSEL